MQDGAEKVVHLNRKKAPPAPPTWRTRPSRNPTSRCASPPVTRKSSASSAVGPRGDCPKWKAFLNRIMKGDAEMIAYLQRICGYCLTGDTSEQAMFFGYGVGANGKGVFLQTVGRILGDYAKAAAIETFTESKTDRHPTELARLHNARLVTATETEGGKHWAESRIKLLTGGDAVTAHFMRKDDFEYVPLFKLFFSGNHKPGLRSIGEAIRRRLKMINFAVTIPENERDPHFADKLKDEWRDRWLSAFMRARTRYVPNGFSLHLPPLDLNKGGTCPQGGK
jgi:P4 family phage/plasmid primase-like protien